MTNETNAGKDCTRAWEIMPWVLQATAPREQGEWLMHHLAQCESCSTEFAQQSRLRSALTLTKEVAVEVLGQASGIGALGARLWSKQAPQQYRTFIQPALLEPAGAIRV